VLRRTYVAFVAFGAAAPFVAYSGARGFVGSVGLQELSLAIAEASYKGDFVEPPISRLLTMALYVAALIGGVLAPLHPQSSGLRRSRWILWLVPLLATAIISTKRGGLLYGGVLFASGYMAGRAYVCAAAIPLKKLAKIGLAVASLISLAFIVLQALRMGRLGFEELGLVVNHLRSYYNPHMAVLGTWLSGSETSVTHMHFGANTFAGVADMLGLSTREAGLYGIAVDFGRAQSNIYTALRPLMEDFGLAGFVAFTFVLGVVGGLGWKLLRSGHLLGAPAATCYFCFVLWSPIASIYAYNTILVSFVVLYAVLWICQRSVRRS
jgi:oligosaccharide repeat unit polymerase